MGRTPCCDKSKVKRGSWSPEEDEALKNYLHKHGTGGNWISLPQKAGLKRCGKSCRLRWLNYLRPDIKHGAFSEEEDEIIFTLYGKIGSRWSIIASQLPGRTDNDVKNHWNTKLKKKLSAASTMENSTTNMIISLTSPTQTYSINPTFSTPFSTPPDHETIFNTYKNIGYNDIPNYNNNNNNYHCLSANINNNGNNLWNFSSPISQEGVSISGSSSNSIAVEDNYTTWSAGFDHHHHQQQLQIEGLLSFDVRSSHGFYCDEFMMSGLWSSTQESGVVEDLPCTITTTTTSSYVMNLASDLC